MSTDFLLEKLCKYFASQLQLPISIYDRHNLAAMLSPFTNGASSIPSISSFSFTTISHTHLA